MRRKNKIIIFIMIIAILFLGTGYAAINNLALNIIGTVNADSIIPSNMKIGDYIDLGTDIISNQEDWRILYWDENGIYVILSDYLPSSYAQKAGLQISGDYGVTLNGNRDAFISIINNTSNWTDLTNSIPGATAVGTPSAELIMKSYNKKYGTSLTYTARPELKVEGEKDLYVPHTAVWKNCYGYWLGTAYEKNTTALWSVRFSKKLNNYDGITEGEDESSGNSHLTRYTSSSFFATKYTNCI